MHQSQTKIWFKEFEKPIGEDMMMMMMMIELIRRKNDKIRGAMMAEGMRENN